MELSKYLKNRFDPLIVYVFSSMFRCSDSQARWDRRRASARHLAPDAHRRRGAADEQDRPLPPPDPRLPFTTLNFHASIWDNVSKLFLDVYIGFRLECFETFNQKARLAEASAP